jgi:RNA ligase (TIGR02306 family)
MNDVYVRKMASVQEVNGVYPIEGADKICQYGINGWRVVDQVGKYQVGDKVVFCEVDSFIPSTIAPFLTKAGHFPKVFNGVEGEKLRTIRLRKALSQGLILPLSVIPGSTAVGGEEVGDDVSEVLGIQKWEAPPEFTSADARGSFPSFIFKTDQERIQNCYNNVSKYFETETWSMEEKADGSSHTTYFYNGEF